MIEHTIAVLNDVGGVGLNITDHYKMYLIQNLAVDLRYRHTWYGSPISEGLDETLREYFTGGRASYDKRIERLVLKESVKKDLTRVNKISIPPEEISRDKWLELLSTIHYFRNVCCVKKGPTLTFSELNQNRAVICAKDKNRQFNRQEFDLAWQRLEQFGLLDRKHNRVNYTAS